MLAHYDTELVSFPVAVGKNALNGSKVVTLYQ